MIVGITGGIGSGKSTLSARLREAGYPVYDTDSAARRLQNEDANLRNQIVALFGNQAYANNELNRKYIAEIVFKNSSLLQQLNQLVHPAVRADFANWCTHFENKKLLFLECALLVEGEFYKLVDKIILVKAPQHIRIQRVVKRNGLTPEQIIERMKNQLSDEEMQAKSDIVLDTSITDIYQLDILSFLKNL